MPAVTALEETDVTTAGHLRAVLLPRCCPRARHGRGGHVPHPVLRFGRACCPGPGAQAGGDRRRASCG